MEGFHVHMVIRVATFNVAWAGHDDRRALNQPSLRPLNLELLARSIELLGADVISFQEIVDVGVLEAALALVPGSPMSVRDASGATVGSKGSHAESPSSVPLQRVVIAWRPERLDLVEWTRLPGGFTRKPIAARFATAAGQKFVFCAAHLKSPSVLDSGNGKAATKRRKECNLLRAWLTAADPAPLAQGAGDTVVVAGDMNGTIDGNRGEEPGSVASFGSGDPALKELREGLDGWRWDHPRGENGDFVWTTTLDRAIIDHIFATEGLVAEDAAPLVHALESTVADYADFVSDHRPVTLDLTL
jgi:endonuclease/exonuclease/phosphatase family metal-dependent hydrolase